jgi:heat shock protein HslJ
MKIKEFAMSLRELFSVGFISLLLFLAACTPVQPASSVVSTLDGTSWNLAGFGSPKELTPLVKDTEITLDFTLEMVSGSDGCNQYSGNYFRDGENLEIGKEGIMTTRRGCMEDVMQQENLYLEMLKNVQRYSFENDYLILHTSDGALTFEKATPLSLEGTVWSLNGIMEGEAIVGSSIDHTITIQFENDQITGSGGCNNYFSSYKRDGEILSLGEIGSTLMACDEAVNQRESTFLAALSRVSGYQIDRETLTLFDESGNAVMSFSAKP